MGDIEKILLASYLEHPNQEFWNFLRQSTSYYLWNQFPFTAVVHVASISFFVLLGILFRAQCRLDNRLLCSLYSHVETLILNSSQGVGFQYLYFFKNWFPLNHYCFVFSFKFIMFYSMAVYAYCLNTFSKVTTFFSANMASLAQHNILTSFSSYCCIISLLIRLTSSGSEKIPLMPFSSAIGCISFHLSVTMIT